MSESVLILHNETGPVNEDRRFAVSEGGVLDEVRAVRHALSDLGIPCRTAGVARIEDIPGLVSGGDETVVFNLVESLPGETDMAPAVPAICRALGKGCTGGDTACLFLTLEKLRCKAVFDAMGIPTPAFTFADPAKPPDRLPPFPVIVKPIHADASEGITADSVVHDAGHALAQAVDRIAREQNQPSLIEQFIEGREFNVSVIERNGDVEVLPLAEIDFAAFPDGQPRIVDYAAKWIPDSFAFNHTPRIIPAHVDPALAHAIRRETLAAWHAAGCRDYARVDIRVDKDDRVFVIEINANPDISPEAGFAAALAAAQIPYASFVEAMVKNAGRRRQAAIAFRPVVRSAMVNGLQIRRSRPEDYDPIIRLLSATRAFRPDEISVAAEVLAEAIADHPGSGYESYVAHDAGSIVGWVCFGRTPCTIGAFDIYWLAVHPERAGQGLGRGLMAFAEHAIAEQGGRLVVVETGGRPSYAATRGFYEAIGYHEGGRLKDFYAHGDDKIVYLKNLQGRNEVSPPLTGAPGLASPPHSFADSA